MQRANNGYVTPAAAVDKDTVWRLSQYEWHSHHHVDWYTPEYWLPQTLLYWEEKRPVACLAIAADPPPCAWVRLAGFSYAHTALAHRLRQLWEASLPLLAAAQVSQVCWMCSQRWVDKWLPGLGFEVVNHLESFVKDDVVVPATRPGVGVIRPVNPADFEPLAELEAQTFLPMWRHSAASLRAGWEQALSFDVVEHDGELIAFQHSVSGPGRVAHLARITVHPAWQGQGVGSALLAQTINGYAGRGYREVTLNTQADNLSSHYLYQKFGFRPAEFRLPIWGVDLPTTSQQKSAG